MFISALKWKVTVLCLLQMYSEVLGTQNSDEKQMSDRDSLLAKELDSFKEHMKRGGGGYFGSSGAGGMFRRMLGAYTAAQKKLRELEQVNQRDHLTAVHPLMRKDQMYSYKYHGNQPEFWLIDPNEISSRNVPEFWSPNMKERKMEDN